MFSNDLFCRYLLLLFYFDYNIRHTKCSLLSQAKKPINILTEIVGNNSDKDVFYGLPGTVYRTNSTEKPQKQGEVSATDVFALPDYVTPMPGSEKVIDNRPMRRNAVTEIINPFKLVTTSPASDNNYEPVRSSPPLDNYYNYEPSRTSSSPSILNSLDALQNLQLKKNLSRIEPMRTYPSPENMYRYEIERPTLPVNPYELVRSSLHENSTLLQDIYKLEPSRTLTSSKYVSRYKPIQFSALYLDETSWPTKIPLRNLNASTSMIYQYIPLRTEALPKYSYRLKPSMSTTDNFIKPVAAVLPTLTTKKSKEAYQFTPILSYRSSESGLPINTSKSPDDYWNEFIQNEPKRTSKTQDNLNQRWPTKTTVEVYKNKPLNTLIVDGNVYQLLPLELTREPDEYWNEFIRNEHQRTLVGKQTVPLRKSSVQDLFAQVPSQTSKLAGSLYQHESLRTSRLEESFYQTSSSKSLKFDQTELLRVLELEKDDHGERSFKISTPGDNLYQNEPSRSSTLVTNTYQIVPLRTSYPEQDIYLRASLRTSTPKDNLYGHEPVKTSRLTQNVYLYEPLRSSRPVVSSDSNERPRTFKPEQNIYLPEPLRTQYKNNPLKTSRLTQDVYRYEPLRTSRPGENSYQNASQRTSRLEQEVYQHQLLRTSTGADYLYQSGPVRTLSPNDLDQKEQLTTFTPVHDLYQQEPVRTAIPSDYLYPYVALRTFKRSESVGLNEHLRTPILPQNYNLSESYRTFRPPQNMYQNVSSRTSILTENFIQSILSKKSKPQKYYEHYGDKTSSLGDYFYPVLPTNSSTSAEILFQAETFSSSSSSSDKIIQSKVRQGFRTLWQPTVSRTGIRTLPRTILDYLKPTRTTTLFNWNFNDADAAWPKVELIVSTTERSTAPTTPKKSFATYFPFYLRTPQETTERRTNETTNSTTNSTTVWTTRTQTLTLKIPLTLTIPLTIPLTLTNFKLNRIRLNRTMFKIPALIDDVDQYPRTPIIEKVDKDTRCYSCGLNNSGIPIYPSCYHVFEEPGSLYSTTKDKYRVLCKDVETRDRYWHRRMKVYHIPEERRLYREGCFKRFVEIGEVYNERGCRTLEPLRGNSFASYRLAALERSLASVSEGCIVSPHASLTPFSRGVSLYARYHVCVCQGRYCNHGAMVTPSVSLIFLNVLFLST